MPVVVIFSSAILNLQAAARSGLHKLAARNTVPSALSPRLRRVQGPRVTVVQKTCELFSLGVPPPHRRFEQRFLDVARHVAPHIHRGPTQQVREAFLYVGHANPPNASVLKGNCNRPAVFHCHHCEKNLGIFGKDIKSMEDLLIHGLQDIYHPNSRSSNRCPR
jgi:hypothetical protein